MCLWVRYSFGAKKDYAMKIQYLRSGEDRAAVQRELRLLSRLSEAKSPHIVNVIVGTSRH